jgi:hypothetical protein
MDGAQDRAMGGRGAARRLPRLRLRDLALTAWALKLKLVKLGRNP